MEDMKAEKQDDICVLRMSRARANAINGTMLAELDTLIDEAANDDTIRGLVLASNHPRVFSAGIDLHEVSQYDRETMGMFFVRFIDLYESLYLLPKPVVAAISGHAMGGGAVLAIACDIRILARGDYKLALNEIDIGVVLPPGLMRMLVNLVGSGPAREILLSGDPLTPARALEVGLANELVDPDRVMDRALARCGELAQKPPQAFAAIKRNLRAISGHSATGGDRHALDQFLEHWFSAEAEAGRQTLLASLAEKSQR